MSDRDLIPSAATQTSSGKSVTNAAEYQRPSRAEPIPPQQLTASQQTYYQQSKQQIEQQFPVASRSSAIADNGALLGPWSVWMGTPELGTAFAAVQSTISAPHALPPRVQQGATL